MSIFEKLQTKAKKLGLDVGVTLDGTYLLYPSDKHYNAFKNLIMKGSIYKINAYLNSQAKKVA
jgi:allantoicase